MHLATVLGLALPLLSSAARFQGNSYDIPYGSIIEHCNVPGTVALTFDDGPYQYTSHLLDILEKYGAKATFFVNGDNWGRGLIDDESTPWPNTLVRMIESGHQVGSHSWSHLDLSFAEADTRRSEMERLEDALANVLGFYPAYMRPPYGSCEAQCQSDLGDMGYHVVNFDVDTKDYAHNTPEEIHIAMDIFSEALSADASGHSYIVLSHDVHENTVFILAEYMLQTLAERGYKAVTVGECLGDAPENWYRLGEEFRLAY